MAKPHLLKIVNYRQEDIPALQELEKILKREGKEYSEWVRENTEDYVKKHSSGNPTFTIEQFTSNDFKALPTPWEDPTHDNLKPISPEEAKFMLDQFAKWYPELRDIKKRPF